MASAFNVPNTLTGLRILAVPVFLWLFVQGRLGAALAVFIGAMITDLLDGIAARALKQFTKLGAVMDPVADKAMGLSALGLLAWSGRLPAWLLGVLIFREICIFSAIAILNRTGRDYTVRPTRFGKYSTFFVTAATIFALVQAARGQGLTPALAALALVAAECIVVSWAQYLAMFVRLMRTGPSAREA